MPENENTPDEWEQPENGFAGLQKEQAKKKGKTDFMNFLSKMERKFGRFAIPNISLYLIMAYACGYLLNFMNPYIMSFLTLNPYAIIHGQVWRIVTWLLVPPSSFGIWTIVMLFFYWSIGTSLEHTWGTFLYNAYLFQGFLFMILGSFILLGLSYILGDAGFCALIGLNGIASKADIFAYFSSSFSTYFVNMSIFLAYAATFPDAQVLLMFIIPIKVKWMGIAYAALLVYQFLFADIFSKFAIGASLLSFVIFYLMVKKGMSISPKQIKRRHDFKKKMQHAQPQGIARHKCAVCGRTSDTNPELEVRFCSKCEGNYEYCQDHLFTHTHMHTR